MHQHTTAETPGEDSDDAKSIDMVQMWVWLIVGIIVVAFLFKCCSWCAEQNRANSDTPARSLSTIAIIDSAAPEPMSCPRCSEDPPSYNSVVEEPPPPYSSLVIDGMTLGIVIDNNNQESTS
ncbi:uncharacterized protein [Periplaneta americana]|uniref:uncharacterized protein n=1 Tax=Periplaneta americana TaxID=6978 RepID=UPI0037E8F838